MAVDGGLRKGTSEFLLIDTWIITKRFRKRRAKLTKTAMWADIFKQWFFLPGSAVLHVDPLGLRGHTLTHAHLSIFWDPRAHSVVTLLAEPDRVSISRLMKKSLHFEGPRFTAKKTEIYYLRLDRRSPGEMVVTGSEALSLF